MSKKVLDISAVQSSGEIGFVLDCRMVSSVHEQDARGIYATLTALYTPLPDFTDPHPPRFSAEALSVYPTKQAAEIPQAMNAYLRELVTCANAVATSVSCGSILTGTASETDEFSDMGVWLGDLGIMNTPMELALKAVEVLELGLWGTSEITVKNATTLTQVLPIPALKVPGSLQQRLQSALARFAEWTFFQLLLGGAGGRVPVFLLGRVDGQWCGLVSIAVWS